MLIYYKSLNKKVKFNKEVSNLARKLDYIGIDSERRRSIIETCMDSKNKTTYRIVSLKKQMEKTYEEIKKSIEDFEKEYNSSISVKDDIYLS